MFGSARLLRLVPAVAPAARQLSVGVALRTAPTTPRKSNLVREAEPDEAMTELIRNFLEPAQFYQALKNIGIDFFTGVPDSLLKDFCAYVTANAPKDRHVITANEGSAIALASGHYMATKKWPLVYLQNSGIGNTVNPIMSLAHPEVYRVPMLLMVGWRGEPGKKDEPQHVVQGEGTPALLASLGVPFQVLPDYIEGAEKALQTAKKHLQISQGPYALLVKRQTFVKYKLIAPKPKFTLNREGALRELIPLFHDKDVIVGTTGMLSRELFEERVRLGHGHEKDFLTVGSMGHAGNIGLGVALAKPSRRVIVLDGDGAVLMHMGNLATIAAHGGPNFKHIVINNEAHDSVGGQPTLCGNGIFSLRRIAEGCGYRKVFYASTPEEIKAVYPEFMDTPGPVMLEIMVNQGGHRKNLGRPTRSPIQNKEDFMEFLDRV
eukprot:m.220381 g.220381  ORF g.220381 m.220381 type:complete len:434 (+) comp10369_c0_seq1:63-1364(+)